MLFMITQTHSAESCPKDEGGSRALYDPSVEGLTVKAMYGAFPEHTIYYVVESDSIGKVNQFLLPGFKRCGCKIAAVSEEPIVA